MPETKQPGTEIDAALWERFREDVERRHGSIRGNLRNELETAIREYLRVSDEATPRQLDERLQRIEAAVGAAPTDGGTPSTAEHTHTPQSKPGDKSSRSKKVEYLIDQKYDRDGGSLTAETIEDDVKQMYGFGDRTAPKYVQLVVDKLGAKRHPNNQNLIVWGEMEDRIKANIEDDTIDT